MRLATLKRLLCVTLALVLAGVMVACSGTKSSAQGQGAGTGVDISSGATGELRDDNGFDPGETVDRDAGDILLDSGFDGAIEAGKAAPDFVYTVYNGKDGKLSSLKGKVVLINFWASWCGPCVREMPDIAKLKKENPDLVVLAINVSDDPTDAKDFISDKGYDFTWVLDESGRIDALYPSDYIPYTVIVNKDGIINAVYTGTPADPFAVYEAALKQAGL